VEEEMDWVVDTEVVTEGELVWEEEGESEFELVTEAIDETLEDGELDPEAESEIADEVDNDEEGDEDPVAETEADREVVEDIVLETVGDSEEGILVGVVDIPELGLDDEDGLAGRVSIIREQSRNNITGTNQVDCNYQKLELIPL